MFTGIVKTLGHIIRVETINSSIRLVVNVKKDVCMHTKIGDSVSINGVCLTAVDKNVIDENNFSLFFDVVKETIDKSNMSLMSESDRVNVETPMMMNDGFDGHIVQGHVDTTGRIINNSNKNGNWELKVLVEKKFLKFCIEKGSIAIDGISLTIANINQNFDKNLGLISIAIIPHTLENTNLKFRKVNDEVNIEFDFFGKYIEKFLKARMD